MSDVRPAKRRTPATIEDVARLAEVSIATVSRAIHMPEKVAASTLTMEEIAGKRVVAFDGIPCRRTDALLLTEARVV